LDDGWRAEKRATHQEIVTVNSSKRYDSIAVVVGKGALRAPNFPESRTSCEGSSNGHSDRSRVRRRVENALIAAFSILTIAIWSTKQTATD